MKLVAFSSLALKSVNRSISSSKIFCHVNHKNEPKFTKDRFKLFDERLRYNNIVGLDGQLHGGLFFVFAKKSLKLYVAPLLFENFSSTDFGATFSRYFLALLCIKSIRTNKVQFFLNVGHRSMDNVSQFMSNLTYFNNYQFSSVGVKEAIAPC